MLSNLFEMSWSHLTNIIMEFQVHIIFVIAVLIATSFLLNVILQGSSESSEFIGRKRDNYKKCDAEFLYYKEFMEKELLVKGDLIECQRVFGTYDHWSIYVGEGQVVHLMPPNGERRTQIRLDDLKDVMKKSKCRVNNLYSSALERDLNPRSGNAVSKAALDELDKFRHSNKMNVKYHLINFNCEHFATFCAFGTPFSDQVDITRDKDVISAVAKGFVKSKDSLS